METMNNALRGEVVAKYGSMTKFAEAVGWSGRKTRDVVTGRQVMTVDDVEKMTAALSIDSVDQFMRIFFPRVSI
ncbi:MAG: hypothetical protein IJ523_06585 [Succinivibrionaceae bacterium]|nr:hypothetical protein [Succinivibrionaceae bacterium]